ncbi:Lysophospholipase, alpha-beta hydrolase superfamily [Marinobacter antarcticus]|uniref:Lysophospholipase, alpha-beta hydrolase superfamily n=1 Tax=Marinobacter antarcticus TaxID=564117 RepID=A0A1M6QIV4_9GAMM|nr:alpha/beta hydrolase [Marinobacter antarcticus]SHK20209.1 Lysophospholipase, alpha-beta hydrolase superfamily [Marinobacter antarcticus]
MQEQPLSLNGQNNHTITGTVVCPSSPRSALVIAHGMAEHAGRYADFARWLTERDIAVVTMNHRGHGPECPPDQLGHYSDTDGWGKVVDDLNQVLLDTRERFPTIPLALLGHSMGSFIAQSCAQQHPDSLDKLILSATNRIHRPQLWISGVLIGGIRRLHGSHHRSPTIANMSFGKFNRMFRPNRTDCDWLSRDTGQVDGYVSDPLCGFECTIGLWHDFIQGMLAIEPSRWRKDLPVHLFSGSDDPVGEMGKGVTRHFQNIRNAGVRETSLRLFEGGRHEMLNETNVRDVREHVQSLLDLQT